MSSQKSMVKKKLENMHLQERINYGYRKVIIMMLISGLVSIINSHRCVVFQYAVLYKQCYCSRPGGKEL